MTNELVWEKVKKYIPEDKINEFHQVQTMIKNNPADAVGYLNFLFITLSIQRMKQLALKTNNEEINESYFESTTIKIAWELLKYKFNISSEEYKYVVDFCTLSDKKANSITEQDANKAMDLLLMVAEKLELPNYSSLNEVEIAITKDEGSQEVISSNNSVKDSKFVSMLEVLQSSSKESVANADSFGKLQSYMHVDRGIQKEFEEILKELKQKERPGLLLLCGSVGDGKSHLLAYMKAKHSDLFEGVFIHNDSTESYDYDKNSLETLEKVLSQFDMNGTASRPVIIAINLGVLHNFYSKQRKLDKFQSLCDFIDRCGVFDRGQQDTNHDGDFHLLNFADTQPYVLTEDGP
ncbi:DNA phosphorothioation-dependent restriction protein DptF, partial [Streptomyces sp. NPDC002144]